MLIRPGDHGEAVRDVQARLLALGLAVAPDERGGSFGSSTLSALRDFQQQRGLVVDGVVGPATWRELVEASRRLGERTLYLRSPHLRGDDVRALQDRLSALGFDVGRVDGIFGAETSLAVREFQKNYGVPADGIVGDSTVRALAGLPGLGGDTPVASIREREALRRRPPTLAGTRIVLDPGHGAGDPGHVGPGGLREADAAHGLAVALEAVLGASGAAVFLTRSRSACPTDEDRAGLAGRVGADLYVAIHFAGSDDPSASGAAAFYYGHERFESEAGLRLADAFLEEVCALGLVDGRAHAKTFSVLRETRMPAVMVEPAHITNPDEERLLQDPAFVARLAEAVAAGLERFCRDPVPDGVR